MSKKIQIAIAEDDPSCSSLLLSYLHTFEKEYQLELSVSAFADGADLLADFHGQYDLLLLDIEMPKMDGMTTAQQIRLWDHDVIILFITNMAQYAIRGYEVDAMDYILKPLQYFTFSQRLNRAIGKIKNSVDVNLILPLKTGGRKVNASDIYYVESQGHNLIFHTKDGDFTFIGTMKEIEERLRRLPFCRCNKGYLVALPYVDAIKDGCAIVMGQPLLISRGRKKEFMDTLTNFMGGGTLWI